MFAKCDDLFLQERVSSETLPWLFRPNEVIVSQEGPHEIAYVLRSVPKGGESDSVELECWNWAYDGVSLRRKDRILSLSAPAYGTVPISELAIYPLRFASPQTKQRLFDRGQRFWELRNQTHVSYEGPDYNGERVYVGFLFICAAVAMLTVHKPAVGLEVHDRLPNLPQVSRTRRRFQVLEPAGRDF